MKIVPLSFSNNLQFSSITRTVYKDKKTGEYGAVNGFDEAPIGTYLCYRNNTYFFRDDIQADWQELIDIILHEFKDAKKVNVYDFACSDGSEAYSLAISLIEKLGKHEAQKYFPIQASDIDNEMINRAKEYRLQCYETEMNIIKKNTNNDPEKYFTISKSKNSWQKFDLEAKPILQNAIEFKQGNILEEVDKIEPSDSLILCRNFWPYLDSNSINSLILKLSKIDSSSRFVIGDYDIDVYHYFYAQFSKYFDHLPNSCSYIFRKVI